LSKIEKKVFQLSKLEDIIRLYVNIKINDDVFKIQITSLKRFKLVGF